MIKMESVSCTVHTECLNIMQVNFVFKGRTSITRLQKQSALRKIFVPNRDEVDYVVHLEYYIMMM
jgi:hypothetical protein